MRTLVPTLATFMSVSGLDITRGGPVDVQRLTRMINGVYKKGEDGIIADTESCPFNRFTEQELQRLLDSDALLLARSTDCSNANEVVGCVKIDLGVSQDGVAEGERVGEWGGLAVAEAQQGRGVARALVSAAEAELRAAGCTFAQLELLSPAHWKHGHKERLREWYVERLGYSLRVPGDYMGSTTRLPCGTLLLGRFELATESDFTVYRRRIAVGRCI
mmetsp:Transcript_14014/g.28422  ORF Transcript_14014/g.28422 Transcript_14014/m.28422 type:complete len:218 (-) Transcript_14014:8-661(-)